MKSKFYKLLFAASVLLSAGSANAQLITTVAGTGIAGNNSSGGPATMQQLNFPTGICIDPTGDPAYIKGRLFIADSVSNLIRMVDLNTGAIVVYAGGGTTGLADGFAATTAQLDKPTGVAADGLGNVYIADFGHNRIRKVNSAGIITTYVNPTGAFGVNDNVNRLYSLGGTLTNPYGVKCNAMGDLFIADRDNSRIRFVSATTGDITTLAGIAAGYTMDGGPATAAELNDPGGLAYDPATKELYVADRGNSVIRKITYYPSMNISTVAGNHIPGYSGDGVAGGATNAQLKNPSSIAWDPAGFLYIADAGNNAIRVWNKATKTITTLTGNATPGFVDGTPAAARFNNPSGIALATATSKLYITDEGNNAIREIDIATASTSTIAGSIAGIAGYSGDLGPANAALLNAPHAICVDGSGNLLVADAANNVIRKIIPGGIITTVVGDGTAIAGDSGDQFPTPTSPGVRLSNPRGVIVDGSGNIYIASTGANRIRWVHSGVIDSFAGFGFGYYAGEGVPKDRSACNIFGPEGMVASPTGDFFLTGAMENDIRWIPFIPIPPSTTNDLIWKYAGNNDAGYGGLATFEYLRQPTGITVNGLGEMYIADRGNNVVRKVDAKGVMSTFAGTGAIGTAGDGALAYLSQMDHPTGVAYSTFGGGIVYFTDQVNNVVRKVDPTGKITLFAGNYGAGGYGGDGGLATAAACKLNNPIGIDVDPFTGDVYIADQNGQRIRRVDYATSKIYTAAGTGVAGFLGAGGPATSTQMSQPYSVVTDTFGNFFVADRNNHIIRKIDKTGKISTVAGTGVAGFSGDGAAATAAQLSGPTGISIDQTGNLYICDQANNRIRKVDKVSGNISTIAGTGALGNTDGAATTTAKFYYPTSVLSDKTGTNIYIADGNNNRVRKLNGTTVSNFAGSSAGTAGFSGDGGVATSALMSDPKAMCFDKTESIMYVCDFLNNAVRQITMSTNTINKFAGSAPTGGFGGDGGPASSALLKNPAGVWTDKGGSVYISDFSNNRVRKVNVTSGNISTVAGNGTPGYSGDGGDAVLAQLTGPFGISLDTTGAFFIADRDNDVIRKVTPVLLAKFSSAATTACQDSCILFTNESIGIIDSKLWSVTPAGATISSTTTDTPTICFPVPGVYTVRLDLFYGTKDSFATTSVTVYPTPKPTLTQSGWVLSTGGSYGSYTWYSGTSVIPGAVTNTYTFTTPGSYSVEVDSNGCKGTATINATSPLSTVTKLHNDNRYWLSQQGMDNSTVQLYAAHPLDDQLNVVVYDALGKEILTDKWSKGLSTMQIKATNLAPGMYLIKLTNNTTSESLKWLKN